MGNSIHIIMYHYVRELPLTKYPNIKGLLLSQFIQQLDFLVSEGYSFVSAGQVVEAAYGGRALPPNSVLLTFDDGYLDHYTNVFPVLYNRGIPGFFSMPGKILAEEKLLDVNRIHFLLACRPSAEIVPLLYQRLDHYRGVEYLYPSNAELYEKLAKPNRFDDGDTIFIKRLLQAELPETLRNQISRELFSNLVTDNENAFVHELYMSMEQIRLMAHSGMEWGIHGYDHYWMNRLSPHELEKDISCALTVFDNILPRNAWLCCYPYGSVSTAVIGCVKRFGAVGGLTTAVRQADLDCDDIYQLPRWDTNDFPPKSYNFKIEIGGF